MKTSIMLRLFAMFCMLSVAMTSFAESPAHVDEMLPNVDEMLQELEKDHQLVYGALIEVQQVDMEHYEFLLEELFEYWDDFKMLKQEEPELANVEADVQAYEIKLELLEHQYYQSKSKQQKGQLEEQISAQLHKLFDLKVNMRKLEIASLQEELEQLTTELETIVKNKDEHINMKLKQLTQGDIFSW